MKDLLSNEEIDTLLALFRAESGQEPAPRTDPGPDRLVARDEADEPRPISPLDLLKPNRFGRDRLHLLERLFGSAAKAVAMLLTERLRIDVTCDSVAIEQIRFATWRRQLEGPMGIWSIAAEPFESSMVLTMSSGLLRGIVDRLLGGHGRVADVPEMFTSAELTVAEAIVEPLAERIAATLEDVVLVRPRIEGRSGNPATIQAMAPSEVALCAYFQIGGEVLHGDLHLAIAYQDLEPFLDRFAHGSRAQNAESTSHHAATLGRALRTVPLALSVVLGRAELSLRSLLDVRPGDVVRLDTVVGAPLEAQVEGCAKLRGRVERSGSAVGFRVQQVLPAPALEAEADRVVRVGGGA